MDARRFRAGCCRLTALVWLIAASAGCHLPWLLRTPDDSTETAGKENAHSTASAADKAADQPTDLPKAMADDRWVQAGALAPRESGPSGYFWQHKALEAWAVSGGDHRAELTLALANGNVVVATNVAILLARAGDAGATERLAMAVGNIDVRLPLRCAAAEALAHLDDPAAAQALEKLTAQFGQFEGPAEAAYVPRLHAELLTDLARRGAVADNPQIVQALQSPAPEVRRVALQTWLNPGRTGFPETALELRDDSNPGVRAALIQAIAVQRPAQAQVLLTRSLDDLDLVVRLTAIAGLASLGSEESKTTLSKLRKHPSEVARAAIVSALAKLGDTDAVFEAANDKSWCVRQAVAEALARAPQSADRLPDETVILGQTLLHDKSLEVQRHALESVATWPLDQAGPVLLIAMSEGGYQMRKDAARKLGSRWAAAAKFSYDGALEVRTKEIAELRHLWASQFSPIVQAVAQVRGDSPQVLDLSGQQIEKVHDLLQTLRDPKTISSARQQAVEALVQFGPAIVTVLEQIAGGGKSPLPPLIYEEVLPQISPLFAAIEGLYSHDIPQRRTAAAQLVLAAGGKNISPLALERLADIAKTETDPIVWQSLLSASADNPREEAVDMAYMAIGNGSPEVRRRACNYLAAHGDRRHVPVLLPALADLNTPVVIAAVKALGAVGTLDDPRPLIQMLITHDKQVRLEVAVSLARLQVPEGAAALERLSLDADGEICRRAAVAMGQLGDKAYVPTLLGLLTASVDVQNAAFASLTELTGEDYSKTPDGLPVARDEQVRRWQRWNRDQQAGEK